jgi:hypothetical protein
LALIACSNGSDSSGRGAGVCGTFTSELRVEDKFSQESATFARGEPIAFDMRITNNSDSPAALGYDGCPSTRFVVLGARNRKVFDNMPEGTACAMLLRTIDYAPRETRQFELEWNQAGSDESSLVPPGPYTVEARDRSVQCAGDLDRTGGFSIL